MSSVTPPKRVRHPEAVKRARDKWYRANKTKQMTRQRVRKHGLQTWLREHKRLQSCAHCGMSFAERPECLDFHHLDPATKEYAIANSVNSSIRAAQSEMAKCICLCANCHRTHHAHNP